MTESQDVDDGSGDDSGWADAARGRIYAFLGALCRHPDSGNWGRVLNADEQHLAIGTIDALRARAVQSNYPILDGELPAANLDLRCLVVELCQPFEHLKAEYERVLCVRRPRPGCSPFALDHGKPQDPSAVASVLRGLETLYREHGFCQGGELPLRADHIAYELEFMSWLITQRRLARRTASFDPMAAGQFALCGLAEWRFFGDHLAGWVVPLSAGLRNYTGGGYFEPLGRFLAGWIPLERHTLRGRSTGEGLPVATERRLLSAGC